MRESPSPNFLPLFRGKRYRVRIFSSDTVPDVLDELNALGDGKAMEVGAGLAHQRQYIPFFFWCLTPEFTRAAKRHRVE